MVVDTSNEKLTINKLVSEKKEMIFVEGDMIVPDSKPDILNTIDTSATVCIYKKELDEGKVKIDGNVITYIMYIADDVESGVRGLNTSLDFSQIINIDNCNKDMTLVAVAEQKTIESKVLNGRKLNIKVGLEITVKIYSNEEIEVVKKINNCEELQLLQKTKNINSLIGTGSTKTVVKDAFVINNTDNLAEILKSSISLVDKDIKISYNKVLAKAEANIKIMYLTEEKEIKVIENKIPIVGFIDIQNVSEENICDTNFEIKNIVLKPNNAQEHSIYIELEVEMACMAYEKKNIDLIEDMYSPCKQINFNQKEIKTIREKSKLKEKFKINETVKIDELTTGKLIDVDVCPIINNKTKSNNKISYEGEVQCNFIYSTNNSVSTKKVNIPLNCVIENVNETDEIDISEEVTINSKDFIVQSGAMVECNLELLFYIDMCKKEDIKIIQEINLEENTKQEDYSLIIYVVKKQDTLWEIAKRYRSTVDDIVRVNEIEDPNIILTGSKLFIPKYSKKGDNENTVNSSIANYA